MPSSPLPQLSIAWTNAIQQDILLQFELSEPATAEDLAELERLVRSFVALGGHGGFARETISPSDSLLSLTRADLGSRALPTFMLAGRGVDVRAFQLVRHSAWKWSARTQMDLSVRVSVQTQEPPPGPVQLADATWGTEEMAYPPLSQRLQIRIEREDPADYQKERRCVVEFGRRVPGDVFESVVNRIGQWVTVLGQGAYGPPVKPAFEAEVWQENLAAYDDYSVELALSLFEASEFAWNTLANCLQPYSDTVEPIALVTIE